ncbi:MAG: energy transducer TonB [Halomonadaceae bacterium]|nr:MAG: energy transducer TonB [Halomonadaceae bacterium]
MFDDVETVEEPDQELAEDQQAGAENASPDSETVTLTGGDTQESYLATLSAHLAEFYEYPRRARRMGQEGTVQLSLRFNRDGEVTEARVEEGSAYRLLDDAALEMLNRASPLPGVPDDIAGERFRVELPVRFEMR